MRSRIEIDESVSVGFVGTYPPTHCGIATFTASLAAAMSRAGTGRRFGVARCVDGSETGPRPAGVVAELVGGSPSSVASVAAALNSFDVVVLQHEFGIFAGADGREVVDLVERLRVPLIVVLHTVLDRPSPNQREIVERLGGAAETVVAQSRAARDRLLTAHTLDEGRVRVIPHGARPNLGTPRRVASARGRPLVLTWGLIGPGKGIELGIEAMAMLRDLDPPPLYVVLGQTHPRIVEARGEEYRESLIALARALGVDDLVELDDRYRDTAEVLALVRTADVVLLPYLSRGQVVSGVLVEAIASGKPVVATGFPHADELLSPGSGIVVPHEDPAAIASALRALLTDHERARRASEVAREQAPSLFWDNVGRAYGQLALAAARGVSDGDERLLATGGVTPRLRASRLAGAWR